MNAPAKPKPNLLIIDDSPTIRFSVKRYLSEKGLFGQYFEAEDGQRGLEVLREHPIDLVLCDLVMPRLDGFAFLREMKADEKYADTPVILLTGQDKSQKKISGLDMGASDYLVKPFDPQELIARVRVQLKIKSLQDDLRASYESFRQASITDYLTQLYNRRHFMEVAGQEFKRARRHGSGISILIMDLDHFKSINDTLGHLQGDRVLIEFARLLQSRLRSHDIVARFGGEEFVVLLPMAGQEEAMLVAEKILHATAQHEFEGMGTRQVTVSIGVAVCPPDAMENVEELIGLADGALYQAKSGGRNRIVFAPTKPQATGSAA